METLGAVNVICSDKTGTLTKNEMTVQAVIVADGVFEVSGSGYAPEGGFARDGRTIAPDKDPLLQELARAALLDNDADLRETDAAWHARMDAAASEGMRLLALAVRRSDAATTPPPRRRSASNSASTTRCRQWPAPRSRPSTTRRRCAAPTSAWPWAGRVPRLPRKPPKWCSFASIAHAVEEGRTVYGNLKKALIFILPTNGAQAGMILIAIVLGLTLPITPVQILWVNMVTAVTLALAIAFERPEPNVMREPPRNPAEPLLTRFMLWRIVFVTVFLVAGSLGLFLWELERGMPVEVARTAAINALVMGEIFYLFNCRRLTRPAIGWSGFVGNRAVLFAIGVLVVLQALFNTAPLDALTWLKILAFGVIVYSVVEIEKALVRRRASPSH